MDMSDAPLKLFLQWLEESAGVSLHPGVSIIQSSDGSISVWANRDEPIIHPATVASIPKSTILSPRTCSLSQHVAWAPYGHAAVLSLSLALYSEMLRGAESKWHPYLRSLPSTPVPIARLWGDPHAFPEDADAQEASRWIQGTEIQRELQDEDGSPLMEETHAFYKGEVQPLLDSLGFSTSMHDFLHAYSLVCSRAFLVDAYHGLSMVPVADAFNHVNENHVQLASEFDVCPVCGSLSECPHDRDDSAMQPPTSISLQPLSVDSSDTVEMVTVRSIPPHSEIFNTYGADLGNASLLARYGFALEPGEQDVVTFGWPGSGIALDNDQDQEVFRNVYTRALLEVGDLVRKSTLIYAPKEEEHYACPFTINSDGQASLGLFVWAVWNAFNERPPPEFEDMSDSDGLVASLGYLPRIVTALVQLEAIREETEDAREVEIDDDTACQLLEDAAEALASLCRARAASMGKKGYRGAKADVLGDLIDHLQQHHRKTRLALEYLLSERALLEACAAGWEEIRDYLSGESPGEGDSDIED
ncbi:SET domain-containing protein [Trametes sanguinea]|nr:SET domain-containing protein [Trametes sanguinea]